VIVTVIALAAVKPAAQVLRLSQAFRLLVLCHLGSLECPACRLDSLVDSLLACHLVCHLA